MKSLFNAALLACTAAVLTSAAILEPADGEFYLGAWIDMENSEYGRDTPSLLNQRMGMNFSTFQELPNGINFWDGAKAVANITNVEITNTNASIFLTVYNNRGLTAFTDQDLNDLADQLYNVTNLSGRNVFLRLNPEMNATGLLLDTSLRSSLLATWRRVVTAVRRRAPGVAMVWAPNLSGGYPYGGPAEGQPLSPEDFRILDTNQNGRIDEEDDPYTPYWPGDEFVDWVALSLYFKGTKATWPWRENAAVAAPNHVTQLITGGGEGGSDKYNFYQMFCIGHNKPMAIAESNAAFQVFSNATMTAIAPGPGHLAIARSYWSSYLTSPAFFDMFPKIKLINLFEFMKYENESGAAILRDFRILAIPLIVQAPYRPWGSAANPPNASASVTASTASSTTTGASTVTSAPASTVAGSGNKSDSERVVVSVVVALGAAAMFFCDNALVLNFCMG
ncbi:hypothetical protein BC829DRAFT_435819 [Chytridium lagenaria]|nr:hypothetical protein BC829DRAFT_435819 [Chytridium lagenaria]